MLMKTSKIKIAIFDIDDTLIPRGSQAIIPSAIAAINALKANGIEVMIATGRAHYFIQDEVFTKIKPNYTVTINGACGLDINKDFLYTVPMDREECNALLTYALKHDLAFATKMSQDMQVMSGMDTFLSVYLKGSPKSYILKDYSHKKEFTKDDELPMGIFMMGDESLIEQSSTLAPDGFYAKAYDDAYDVYSKQAGKIRGIEHVLNDLNLTWDEVIAFGDAANDIEMLQHAAIGVAMGNASQEVKDAADYTTKNLLNDGIEFALKHFKLIAS